VPLRNGVAWSPPLAAQLGQKGAVWSPVLHATPDGSVLLFYTESHACFRPTNPKTYMPGGSIKMAKLVIKTGKSVVPMRAEWTAPVTIREQTETQMPWVIANKMLVASNGGAVTAVAFGSPRACKLYGFNPCTWRSFE
jgi:hypothetical protein